MKLWFAASVLACAAFAQDVAAPVSMTPAERAWQESMNNVKMLGYFTLGDSKELHEDAYVIEKITKVSDGAWKFAARIQYGGRDVKVTMNVPVQFAGDVPVINFTRQTVQGMGTYDARVMFFKGGYAGTWGAGDHGGAMFGKIVKLDEMPQDTPVRKPLPQPQ
jgi:hypothetical protein